MAEVRPFKGVLFNVPQVSKVSGEELLAPPYDIITPEYKDVLYEKSPFNIIRIDFGKELPDDNDHKNKYTRARMYLDTWLREKVLVQSPEPCFYSCEVDYSIDGQSRRLRGFLGLVRLEELGKGTVYPHECTHSKPKKDRLDIMRYCEGNVSPIFSLYNSPQKKTSGILDSVNKAKPYLEATDPDGSVHRLWQICDKTAIAAITAELRDKAIFIADGHHRYETALEYQRQQQAAEGPSDTPRPYDYVLMFLANMSDEGLTILPTHRLVKKVPGNALDLLAADFDIDEVKGCCEISDVIFGKRDVFGFYKGGNVWYKLSYKGQGVDGVEPALKYLDVTVLHELIFSKLLKVEGIAYEMDVDRCLQLVKDQAYQAAFFLNPTQVGDVERVALASLRMPPKSTYFYPKLMTGMVLNIFKNSL
ncbi:MAG: DUF1015 domain-containing protein [Nitrospirae bacterium]|nr:MAG: DUF1015 domain-containing protein [Nitrospirota bacterium]